MAEAAWTTKIDMNPSLHHLHQMTWACLAIGVFYGLISFIVIRRRPLWIRFLDAEAAFWKRVGLPKLSFDRRFGESRFFAGSLIFFTISFLVLAVACTVLYNHLAHGAR